MTMTTNSLLTGVGPSATATREARRVRRLLNDSTIRVFLPERAHEGGIFRARKGGTDLLDRVTAQGLDVLIAEGMLALIRTTKAGRLYKTVAAKDRVKPPRIAPEHRSAAWRAADQVFASQGKDESAVTIKSAAESPIGWLARRRDADGKPFLSRDEVAAAERLRADFERSQLAPGVTQDWTRFMTSGVRGGSRVSAQERDVGGGASAARDRLADALGALGPGLSDVTLRVCCFLEGIEAIETSMHWSRRSGKVVLKIALQRLAAFYEEVSVRNAAKIESWQSESHAAERASP
jgi:hypothetical protein